MAKKQGQANQSAKKKVKKNISHAIACIQATFNNTIISLTDPAGNTISWSSSGGNGFKNSRKSTPFAAGKAAETAAIAAREHGVNSCDVIIRGPGAGRESAVRALQAAGIVVKTIKDLTPIPHNGVRSPKRRRV
ncbi:MAG: 30S ribosomal protein S11 [Sumerlaeia bacterium]